MALTKNSLKSTEGEIIKKNDRKCSIKKITSTLEQGSVTVLQIIARNMHTKFGVI